MLILPVPYSKVGKLYKGLLDEMPVPENIKRDWEALYRCRLEQHLLLTTEKLANFYPHMRPEETTTEVELCMVGKPQTATIRMTQAKALAPTIRMKPSLWIACGSLKCKQKVKKEVPRLPYLQSFLCKHGMGPIQIKLGAPQPLTATELATKSNSRQEIVRVSFAIQRLDIKAQGICGARARFVAHTADDTVEHYSTIGGFVSIDGRIFGVTTAHGIVNECLYRADGNDKASGHEEYSSDSSFVNSESEDASDADIAFQCPSVVGSQPDRIADLEWNEQPFPKAVAYLRHGTRAGDWSFPESSPETSDFALFEADVFKENLNTYCEDSLLPMQISKYLPANQLRAGPVQVVSKGDGNSEQARLLGGDFSIIVNGVLIRTKKIVGKGLAR